MNGEVPTVESLHQEISDVKVAHGILAQTVKSHGTAIGELRQEIEGSKETILAELLNVKRDAADAVSIALAPSRREIWWRRFWRFAHPALVAAFLEALHRLGVAHSFRP